MALGLWKPRKGCFQNKIFREFVAGAEAQNQVGGYQQDRETVCALQACKTHTM